MNVAGELTKTQELRLFCLQSALEITGFDHDADVSDVIEVANRVYRYILIGADTIYESHRNAPGSVRTVGDLIAMVEKTQKATKS